MKKQNLASIAVGSAFAAAALTPMAHAASDNPFAARELPGGYQLAQADTKNKDASCGADKKSSEAKCGADKKGSEGKCGGDKKPDPKSPADKKM